MVETIKQIPKHLREFVIKKALNESAEAVGRPEKTQEGVLPRRRLGSTGKFINGNELALIQEVLDELPDKELATKIRSWFSFMPKYQTLNMLVNNRSEVSQRFPNHLVKIIEAAVEVDYKTETTIPEVR